MKPNNSTYNQKRGKAHSPSSLNGIKRFILWLLAVVGGIIGLFLWVILKPAIRGIGWLISIFTALAVLYWLLT